MANRTPVPQRTDTTSASGSGVEGALNRCLQVLAHRPRALISDIDGTLSRIVPRPEDATVEPALRASLEGLASTLDMVALVTGRDEATARDMVGAPALTYVGNYGLLPGAKVPGLETIQLLRGEVEAEVVGMPCVQIEAKATGFSLHYRNCDNPDATRRKLLDVLDPMVAKAGARVLEGKRVIELVPAALPDKRSAFQGLLDSSGAKGLVYLGDDLSDVPVFQEIARRKADGTLNAVGIAVADGETDPSILEAADVVLRGVEQVALLLELLAESLRDDGGPSHG